MSKIEEEERKREEEGKRERNIPSTGSPPKWTQWSAMGHAKARSLALHPGLPRGWQ